MLQFNALSFWEKREIIEGVDFLIIGGGIVGISTALSLREKFPKAKIVLLERSYISTGASTKNAGFACFGSVTELLDDLKTIPAQNVWETVAMRYQGLRKLYHRFGESIDFNIRGSWDLMNETSQNSAYFDKIDSLNTEIFKISGEKDCFSWDESIQKKCGFQQISGGFYNRLEGEINTGKLYRKSNYLLAQAEIITLFGIEVLDWKEDDNSVEVSTNFGELTASKLFLCTNAFARKFLPEKDISPARAQVLVTEKIPNFSLPGTFHYDAGYYYFRSVDNRILLGGGRNLDKLGETTEAFQQTEMIQNSLEKLLTEVILPNRKVKIDYRWSGIMAVGKEKKPIIETIGKNCFAGVRMGGMGVAIGSLVGELLAEKVS